MGEFLQIGVGQGQGMALGGQVGARLLQFGDLPGQVGGVYQEGAGQRPQHQEQPGDPQRGDH